ncbi:interleukin-9 receptor [Ctenodactylus gundi]
MQSFAGWTLERKAGIWVVAVWLPLCTCVCWEDLVPAEERGSRAGPLTCLSNGILRIDCCWSAPVLGQGSASWLLFTSNQAPGLKHRCIFQGSVCSLVLPPEEVLLPSDNFTITLHCWVSGKEQVSLVDPQFLPWRHVKLDPPSDLRSNISSGSCVLTWSLIPALEPMATLLSYELAFKQQEEAWERARHKDRIVGVTWLILEAVELEPGSTFEARLRVRMTVEGDVPEEWTDGQWSEWSQPVCFPAPRRRGLLISPGRQLENTLVAVAIFLLLTGLTYLLFKLSSRVKRTCYPNVPSPAAFFQPLYIMHSGNFQTWTGAYGAGSRLPHDGDSPAQGALESSVLEVVTLLTCVPVQPGQALGVEEEESTGPGVPGSAKSKDVLPVGAVESWAQPSAYLPQEDWALVSLTRPDPPGPEAGSSDYCAAGCCEECHSSVLPATVQGPEPIVSLAGGLSCVQQGPGLSQKFRLREDSPDSGLPPTLGVTGPQF